FSFTLEDLSTGQTTGGAGTVVAPLLNSGACVVDRGTTTTGKLLPLANFSTISIGSDYSKVSNTCYATVGSSHPIGSFSSPLIVTKWVMYNSGMKRIVALPGALSTDKSSFKDVWKAAN
ncbi:MAG: hypothetical protein ACHQ1H_13870, partial [Nitrososphaerales archaeon]